ncbi:conserved hypothetical protein [Lodderomyces elongisporus NRRL YB-4239]|uniref:Uncharacterized protein n=1 Tax=Lodderomyces elongisporus (strain ATCC 11503 / CBS 2605 / JCM 1781 / NBRC 1676 / NRRL YB-4239) TaxID=379508 RepID=A5E0J1_LODEL|nr:conserved hypothetical protein [Lodderomyces elongisporus NRRL YB-4239]
MDELQKLLVLLLLLLLLLTLLMQMQMQMQMPRSRNTMFTKVETKLDPKLESKAEFVPTLPQKQPTSSRLRKSSQAYRETLNITEEKPPWRKLLYLKQPYADNYTDTSFLSQLKRNTTVAKYSYRHLVNDFMLIVFYISCILIVILVFVGIYANKWDPMSPTMASTIIILPSFLALRLYNASATHSLYISFNIKSYLLITFMLLIASPILKSLTKSTSSDSIWAISSMLCVANTLFYEYSAVQVYKPIISTNISLSNAIVLASRLNTTMDVFLFILFAIQINILLPLLDASLRSNMKLRNFHYFVMGTTFVVVNVCIWQLLNYQFLIYWLSTTLIILLLMPAYFLSLQRYKNELQGPWDIAKPKLSKNQ